MKRRLFWKILLAFWLTFFAITQGMWLLFQLSSIERPPPERLLPRQMGPVIIAAAAEAVGRDGPAGFDTLRSHLPAEQRGRLTLAPASSASRSVMEREIRRDVTSPQGQTYRISYQYGIDRPLPVRPLN